MRFDWYAATIDTHPVELVEFLASNLRGTATPARPLHGYAQAWDIVDGQGMSRAHVLAGGSNGNPHAWASGSDTDAFQEAIRGHYGPRHYVTRFDASEDFQEPGAFTRLRRMVNQVAKRKGVATSQFLPGDSSQGRTFYAGARSSPNRVTVYEKGKQMAARHPEHASIIPKDWVRIEARIRPHKTVREAAAVVTPEQAWCFADWTSEVGDKVFGIDLPRIKADLWRISDDERAFQFMCRQYGPMLARMERELGNWCMVGKTIGEMVESRRTK